MISKILAFTDSEGKAHGTLEAAQKAELIIIFGEEIPSCIDVATFVLKHKDKIVDILTTKPNSLTKARKVNGGTKTRTVKPKRHEAEQFPLPIEDNTKPAA
jgi:hypothetical protein